MQCFRGALGAYCSFSAETHGVFVNTWPAYFLWSSTSHARGPSSRGLCITLERYTDWGPRNHMPELSMYYVAGGKRDQLLREDTSDMIWILKIYQRANNTHGFLQILCWEMCVKSPERCFIQEGQGARRLFDMMQEYFYFVCVAHL